MQAHSLDMPTLTTAESITFVWKVLHESMVVRLVRCSRLEILTARVTARIQRMFLAGEYSPRHPRSSYRTQLNNSSYTIQTNKMKIF
jgi:hypothetical protein